MCQDSSFSHSYVCCIHSGTGSADVLQESGLEHLAADSGKNYQHWPGVMCPGIPLPGRKS